MEAGKILAYAFFWYLATGVPLLLVVALYVHLRFPEQIERDLFNEHYFNRFELETFSSFPMSILKTLAFIRGTVAPGSIQQRFGGYDFRSRMSGGFFRLCQIYVLLLLVGAAFALVMTVYGISVVVGGSAPRRS